MVCWLLVEYYSQGGAGLVAYEMTCRLGEHLNAYLEARLVDLHIYLALMTSGLLSVIKCGQYAISVFEQVPSLVRTQIRHILLGIAQSV